jgi:hypothetical protein
MVVVENGHGSLRREVRGPVLADRCREAKALLFDDTAHFRGDETHCGQNILRRSSAILAAKASEACHGPYIRERIFGLAGIWQGVPDPQSDHGREVECEERRSGWGSHCL